MFLQEFFVLIVFAAFTSFDLGLALRNVLLMDTNHCVCPGDTLSYECCVASEPEVGSTIWRGSVLASQCPETGGEIIIRHLTSKFTQMRTCGNITGRGTEEGNGYYNSQLNITVDSSFDNKTVECIYDNGTTKAIAIEIINLKDAYNYPPPRDVRITRLDSITLYDQSTIEVTLFWSPAVTDCSTQYFINSDCGLCPNTSTTDITTAITCSAWSPMMMEGEYCTFKVRTGICNNSLIGAPRTIWLTLKAPDVPFVEVIPLYSYETDKLSVITTIFSDHNMINNSESVYDTEIVNTPVINFIIDYYIISRSINLTFNIDIQDQGFCNDSKGIQLCKHEYDISLTTFQQSVCDYQTNIIVSVSARNAFGHGPANNTSIGCKNTFVMVIFHDPKYTSVTCKFLALRSMDNMLRCSITYGNGSYKQQNTTGPGVSDTVNITINTTQVHQLPSNYRQFTIIAIDGTLSTAIIEGTFNITGGGSRPDTENVNIAMFAAIATTVIVVGITVVLGLILLFMSKNKLKMLCHASGIQTFNNEQQSDPQQTDRYMVHEEQQFTTVTQNLGVYSLVGPIPGPADKSSESTEHRQIQGIYADVQVNQASNKNAPYLYPMSDDRIQYAELNHNEMNKVVTTANTDEFDKEVNLDNLLIQLREEVTPHCQNFGLTIGVPREVIVKYSEYPPDQCMIEILDYWLRHHNDAPLTWRDVAVALRQIKLHQLAEKILKVYVTGQLPLIEIDASTLHGAESERECTPELPPKPRNWQ